MLIKVSLLRAEKLGERTKEHN